MSINKEMDKDVVQTYNWIILSHKKKEWNNAISSNMDGPTDYHTKWSKSDKDKYAYDITYTWDRKYETNLLTKQKQTHRQRKQAFGY